MAEVEPAALVHELQEPPDVLDVRVAEREVVAPQSIHWPSRIEPSVNAWEDCTTTSRQRRANSASPYSSISRFELSPSERSTPTSIQSPWQSKPVLVALVESVQRLVALEDVLQRPPPGGVDAEHHPVGGHRPVDEAEPRPAGVLLAQAREGPSRSQSVEDLPLERVVIRLVRERCEHAVDSRSDAGKEFQLSDVCICTKRQ